jgi:hypothetical protein
LKINFVICLNSVLNGFLVDAKVKPVWKDITNVLTYTVPSCKVFVLKGVSMRANSFGKLLINGIQYGLTGYSDRL